MRGSGGDARGSEKLRPKRNGIATFILPHGTSPPLSLCPLSSSSSSFGRAAAFLLPHGSCYTGGDDLQLETPRRRSDLPETLPPQTAVSGREGLNTNSPAVQQALCRSFHLSIVLLVFVFWPVSPGEEHGFYLQFILQELADLRVRRRYFS